MENMDELFSKLSEEQKAELLKRVSIIKEFHKNMSEREIILNWQKLANEQIAKAVHKVVDNLNLTLACFGYEIIPEPVTIILNINKR